MDVFSIKRITELRSHSDTAGVVAIVAGYHAPATAVVASLYGVRPRVPTVEQS